MGNAATSQTQPVTYTEAYPEQLPGVEHLTCPRLHATLTPASCAARHDLALGDTYGHYSACRSCPIGRVHATGKRATPGTLSEAVSKADTSLATLCVRCGRQSSRMVSGRGLCISCYNREQEAR